MFRLENFTVGIYKKHKSNCHLLALVNSPDLDIIQFWCQVCKLYNLFWTYPKVQAVFSLVFRKQWGSYFKLLFNILYHSLIVIVLETVYFWYFLETGKSCFVTKNCSKASSICAFILSRKQQSWFQKDSPLLGNGWSHRVVRPLVESYF